jgi:Zn-dependent metalloprotease
MNDIQEKRMLRRASALLVAGLIGSAHAAPPPAQAAFTALKQQQQSARAVWRNARPALISGIAVPTRGSTAALRAQDFLARHATLLGAADFEVVDVQRNAQRTLVRLAQQYGGVPVADRSVVLTLNAEGAVTRVINDTAPLVEVTPARIGADEAARRAFAHIHGAAAQMPKVTARKRVFAAGGQGVEGYLVSVARAPMNVVEVRVNGVDGSVFGIKEQQQW